MSINARDDSTYDVYERSDDQVDGAFEMLDEVLFDIIRPYPDLKRKRVREVEALAIREIRSQQRQTDLTFPVETFASLVQYIAQDYRSRLSDLGFEPDAMLALQTAAEGHLVHCFKVAGLEAIHAGREVILTKDMHLARHLLSFGGFDC